MDRQGLDISESTSWSGMEEVRRGANGFAQATGNCGRSARERGAQALALEGTGKTRVSPDNIADSVGDVVDGTDATADCSGAATDCTFTRAGRGKRRAKLTRLHSAKDLTEKSGTSIGHFPAFVEVVLAEFRTLLSDAQFCDRIRSKFLRVQLDADEGLQDTALRLLNPDTAAGYRREKGSHEQFALSVASWVAVEHWKRRHKLARAIPAMSDAAWSGLSPLEVVEVAERNLAVSQAVAKLSPSLKSLVNERYFDSIDQSEAAMTPAQRCAHHRALRKLRTLLARAL